MSTAARLLHNTHGAEYMPLNLKGVLQRYGLAQNDWADAVIQATGVPLSLSAATQILNWNTWPKKTPPGSIKKQTEDWLLARGVLTADLVDLWAMDADDRYRLGHPAGAHIGQTRGQGKPAAVPEIDPIGETEMLHPSTKRHFGLAVDPFQYEIQSADDVFLSADQRYVREAMYSVARFGGFLAVIGESGSGKTTLFNDLYDRIEAEKVHVTICSPSVLDLDLNSLKTRLTARRMLESILYATTQERPGQSIEKLTKQVQNALIATTNGEERRSVVLMIEEAHSLMPATMKMVKRLLELKHGHRYLIGAILIGQPELGDLLDEARHPDLREVIRRCTTVTLDPLGGNLEDYLSHKFKRRAIDPARIIAPDAYDAIRERLSKPIGRRTYSQLYPLVVNNLIAKAMNKAAETGEDRVTGDVIRAI